MHPKYKCTTDFMSFSQVHEHFCSIRQEAKLVGSTTLIKKFIFTPMWIHRIYTQFRLSIVPKVEFVNKRDMRDVIQLIKYQ
jgi:hypothetical protein